LTAAVGEDSREVLQTLLNMGTLANRRKEPKEAERLFRLSLERGRAALSQDDPFLVAACTNLAVLLGDQKRFEESLPLLQEALGTARRVYGETHRETLGVLTQLGGLYLFSGNWPEAEKAYSQVIRTNRGLPEDQRGNVLDPQRGLASALEYQGRPAEAEATRRELLDTARRGRPALEVATCLANLGNNLLAQHKWDQAEPVLRECLALRRQLIVESHPPEWLILSAQSMLGEAVLGQAELAVESDPAGAAARFAEAEPLITPAAESVAGAARAPLVPPGSPDRKRQAIERARRLYTSWERLGSDAGHARNAEAWQRRLSEYDAQPPQRAP
jgi:tetratricopeptide (TPR) repeat protein